MAKINKLQIEDNYEIFKAKTMLNRERLKLVLKKKKNQGFPPWPHLLDTLLDVSVGKPVE